MTVDPSLRQGAALRTFIAALVGAVEVADVERAVALHGARAAGAAFATLAVFDPLTNCALAAHDPVIGEGIRSRWAQIPLSEPTPLCEAILSGVPVVIGTIEEMQARYPNVVADALEAHLVANASMPLLTAEGTVGAVGFAWMEPTTFTDEELDELSGLADLVARALERVVARRRSDARTAEERDTAVEVLQRAVLPTSLPHNADLDISAAYLPADGARVGGDWYDAFAVGSRTCIVVGDVAGHGMHAVTTMALVRNALRAFADEDPSPARVLTRANRMLVHLAPRETASAIVAVWDPRTRLLVRANAGHPPVLRCRAGEVGYLAAPHDVILGVDPNWEYREQTKTMRPGTTLVLYTDGLIEVPPRPLDDSMNSLLVLAVELPGRPSHEVCDRIVTWRRRAGARTDDICVLAARLP